MAAIINARDNYLQSAARSQTLALTITYVINKDFGADISVINPTGINMVSYTFKQGDGNLNSYETSTVLAVIGSPKFILAAKPPGIYVIWCFGTDINGNTTTPVSISITFTSPTVSSIEAQLDGPNLRLTWSLAAVVSGSMAVDYYEIRSGDSNSTWDSATLVGTAKATTYTTRLNYSGLTRKWWVAAKSIAENSPYSIAVSCSVSINTPTSVTSPKVDIVDNNAIISWTPSTVSSTQLPIDYYNVKKGSTYASSVLIGSNGNSTFSSVFEQASGTYKYWITPYDTAGNPGTEINISATISQPPDYILKNNYNSTFASGTYSNLFLELGYLVGPVNTTQTWTTHYLAGADGGITPWTSPSAQIAAGYPIYIAPNVSTGTYEEILDYGTSTIISSSGTISSVTGTGPWTSTITGMSTTTGFAVGSIVLCYNSPGSLYSGTATYAVVSNIISSTSMTCTTTGNTAPVAGNIFYISLSTVMPTTTVTSTLSTTNISGSVIVTCTLSHKLVSADAWTVLSPASSALLPIFRYLRVSYTFTPASTPGSNLIKITGLNIKLAIKLRNDSGVGVYDSAKTDGQNFVSFAYPFLSADTPLIQPSSSTVALTPLVIYSGGANPTGFSVRLYDRNGTLISGAYSWTARGY